MCCISGNLGYNAIGVIQELGNRVLGLQAAAGLMPVPRRNVGFCCVACLAIAFCRLLPLS